MKSVRLNLMVAVLAAEMITASVAWAKTWKDGTPIQPLSARSDVVWKQVADWSGWPERHWAGPALWTNRLQDWVVRDGALHCDARPANLPCRTAHLLTHQLSGRRRPFRMEVIIRLESRSPVDGFAGFLIGAGEGRLDYRGASLVQGRGGKGGGILCVLNAKGERTLQFREMGVEGDGYPPLPGQFTHAQEPIRWDYHQLRLDLEGIPVGDTYTLRLSLWARHAGTLLGAQEIQGVPARRLRGNVALVAHPVSGARYVFADFRVAGAKFDEHPEQTFGPIAGCLFSTANGTLKLSAQFVHLGRATLPPRKMGKRRYRPRMTARLRYRKAGEEVDWTDLEPPQVITVPDYLATFRVDGWDASVDHEVEVDFTEVEIV